MTTWFHNLSSLNRISLYNVCETGKRWIRQMMTGTFLVPALVCGMAFFINFLAIYYHSSRSIPFVTMVRMFTLCFELYYADKLTSHLGESTRNGHRRVMLCSFMSLSKVVIILLQIVNQTISLYFVVAYCCMQEYELSCLI